jgi:DNA polymerase-3 subunit delta
MKFDEITRDIANKVYYPVYLLMGEEPYFIDEISDSIEKTVLDEGEKEFNQSVLYGKDVDVLTIVSYAKRYPMMSNYQVVIVKEAQDIKKIEELDAYVKDPLKSTILVLCYKYGKVDKRKTFVKAIEKSGVLFESAKMYEDKVPSWVTSFVAKKGYKISPKAAILLSDSIGNDLERIANEIEKIIINTPKGVEITEEIISENTGISKDFNIFELQKALGSKNVYKANQIINHFISTDKENPPQKVIPIIYSYFSKILTFHHLADKSRNNAAAALSVSPFFVDNYINAARNYNVNKITEIISVLRDYDMRSKGVGVTSNEPDMMKEMIYKIMH